MVLASPSHHLSPQPVEPNERPDGSSAFLLAHHARLFIFCVLPPPSRPSYLGIVRRIICSPKICIDQSYEASHKPRCTAAHLQSSELACPSHLHMSSALFTHLIVSPTRRTRLDARKILSQFTHLYIYIPDNLATWTPKDGRRCRERMKGDHHLQRPVLRTVANRDQSRLDHAGAATGHARRLQIACQVPRRNQSSSIDEVGR